MPTIYRTVLLMYNTHTVQNHFKMHSTPTIMQMQTVRCQNYHACSGFTVPSFSSYETSRCDVGYITYIELTGCRQAVTACSSLASSIYTSCHCRYCYCVNGFLESTRHEGLTVYNAHQPPTLPPSTPTTGRLLTCTVPPPCP